MDVVFDELNVVQPDIFLICDASKIKDKNIQGAPDIIFEIRSPSTEYKDRTTKFQLYQQHGVNTYIIVNSTECFLEVFRLKNGKYNAPDVLGCKHTLDLEHPALSIPLDTIFPKPKPLPQNSGPESSVQ